MFDKLDDMLIHYEELMRMLGDPDVTQDTKRFTKLMKEQAELAPIRERRKAWEQRIPEVYEILKKGSEEARKAAAKTMQDVRHAMQIDYFAD